MNPDLVATFTAVAADLATAFGGEALHTAVATGNETLVRIVLETKTVPVGDFGERMEPQTTVQIPASSGALVGDTFTVAGDPDPIVWTAAQLLNDDGYLRTFAVRSGT